MIGYQCLPSCNDVFWRKRCQAHALEHMQGFDACTLHMQMRQLHLPIESSHEQVSNAMHAGTQAAQGPLDAEVRVTDAEVTVVLSLPFVRTGCDVQAEVLAGEHHTLKVCLAQIVCATYSCESFAAWSMPFLHPWQCVSKQGSTRGCCCS